MSGFGTALPRVTLGGQGLVQGLGLGQGLVSTSQPASQPGSRPSSRPSSNPGPFPHSALPLSVANVGNLPGGPSVPITIIRMAPQLPDGASVKLKLVRPNGPNGPMQVSHVPQLPRMAGPGWVPGAQSPQSLSSRLPGVQAKPPSQLPVDRRKDNLGQYRHSGLTASPAAPPEELDARKQMVKFKNRMVTMEERNRAIAARKRREREKRKLRELRARLRTDLTGAAYDSVLFPERCRYGVPPREEQMSVCWQQVIRHHVLAPIAAANPLPALPALPNVPRDGRTPLLGSKDAVLTWQVEDVVRWSRGLKFLPSQAAFARQLAEEAIDGEALLSLSQDDLRRVFRLKMGPALKLANILRSILHDACPIRHYSYGKTPKASAGAHDPHSDQDDGPHS